MGSAQWIWYPGDFEIWLRREVELRRDERLVVTPPIWRVDSPYPSVRFRKHVDLARPETIDVLADGSLRLLIDNVMVDTPTTGLKVDAGEHQIVAEVANTERFPALAAPSARGPTLPVPTPARVRGRSRRTCTSSVAQPGTCLTLLSGHIPDTHGLCAPARKGVRGPPTAAPAQ